MRKNNRKHGNTRKLVTQGGDQDGQAVRRRVAAYFLDLKDANSVVQKDFGEQIGTAQQTIQTWVTGKTPPKAGPLVRLCRVAGLSSDWLLLGEGSMFRAGFQDVDAGREARVLRRLREWEVMERAVAAIEPASAPASLTRSVRAGRKQERRRRPRDGDQSGGRTA